MAEPHDLPDATAVPAPARPPRPLWYRRGLMVVFVLLLLTGAGVAWRLNQAKPEHAAVLEIRDAGGSTQTSWEFRFLREPDQGLDLANRPEASNQQVDPIWPSSVLDALGTDFFTRVTAIHLPKGTAPALLASTLPRLPTVEMLSIADSRPLAGALAPVRALPNLRGVYVDGAGLKPADFADLAAVPDLRLLAVGPASKAGTLVDADLAELAGATRLEGFRLSREPAVTDEAVAALVAKWPALEEFTLARSRPSGPADAPGAGRAAPPAPPPHPDQRPARRCRPRPARPADRAGEPEARRLGSDRRGPREPGEASRPGLAVPAQPGGQGGRVPIARPPGGPGLPRPPPVEAGRGGAGAPAAPRPPRRAGPDRGQARRWLVAAPGRLDAARDPGPGRVEPRRRRLAGPRPPQGDAPDARRLQHRRHP